MALKRNERYPGRFGNPNAAHPQGAFKNRTSPTSQDGSYLESDWANDWDGFFARLLTVAGVTANGNVDTGTSSQYYDALMKVVSNASAPPIGMPFFWASATMPNTVVPEWSEMVFLKWNGATFSATTYPKLALIIPSLQLVESRGEFPRIWDDGRGVDAGRVLGSAQSGQNFAHTHNLLLSGGTAGSGNVIGIDNNLNGIYTNQVLQPGGSGLSAITPEGGNEARPRNIAFNFLVRAK